MTAHRLKTLWACAEPAGLRPLTSDWQAIYWLREQGYVAIDRTAPRRTRMGLDWPLYRATQKGTERAKTP